MIDFDRFWAEPGCLPGMSKEETDTYLRQQMGGVSFEEVAPDELLDPKPGITDEQILAWESEHRVRLPDILRHALARQNGGYVYDSQFRVLPLEEMAPPDDEFWEYASYEEEEVPDQNLLFALGEDEFGGTCYLNYARGPQKEPSVYDYHSDPGDLNKCSDSVMKFFGRMLKTAEAPSVDWSETASLEVIARETIDLSRLHPKGAELEQILGRLGGAFVLFTHERTPSEERFTKTTLPEPLLPEAAMIMRRRGDPMYTFGLMLQPKDADGIVEKESARTRDGKWKNSTSHGVPVYVQFEAHDRTRLEALRRTLFGDQTADRVEADDKRRDEIQQKMAALTPEERQAAALTTFQHMKQRLFPQGPPKPEDMPPEAAALQELLQRKLAEIEQRVKSKTQPINPDLQRLLGEMINPPDRTDEKGER